MTVFFSFGSHPSFPAIQKAMAKTEDFKWSAGLAFLAAGLLYAPMVAVSFWRFGSAGNMEPNVLDSLTRSPGPQAVASVAILSHVICAIVLLLHPVAESMEGGKHYEGRFVPGWGLKARRALLLLAVWMSATFLPGFQMILALIGSSTVAMLAYVCPSLFLLALERRNMGVLEQCVHGGVILVGTVLAVTGTYANIVVIVKSILYGGDPA